MNRSRYAAGAVQHSVADTSDRRLVNSRRGAGGLLTAPDIAHRNEEPNAVVHCWRSSPSLDQ
jgi:hypothetical protein